MRTSITRNGTGTRKEGQDIHKTRHTALSNNGIHRQARRGERRTDIMEETLRIIRNKVGTWREGQNTHRTRPNTPGNQGPQRRTRSLNRRGEEHGRT